MVVLLTDGGSNVLAARTVERARTLKDKGTEIHVVAIGDQVTVHLHCVKNYIVLLASYLI